MARRKPDLQKLVSLKRQKAEQAYLAAQQAHAGAESERERLADGLKAMDHTITDVDSLILSHQQGHARKLIRDIGVQHERVDEEARQVRSARDVLQRAFDSEQRLKKSKE
ncbi:hypothetical protein [Hyphomonas chukchiensis]|uniref:Uncharacterized protein n=1 Tax=Hyphomonas chukchiensis TaxID=1280947 RepID=A0A062UGP2_9PROT|nr:hypothetical protein [Hyphomonas chukchiensis]KCZ57497.1 hypothetical protein HY30_04820 [Hyphomonas chukchiensis]